MSEQLTSGSHSRSAVAAMVYLFAVSVVLSALSLDAVPMSFNTTSASLTASIRTAGMSTDATHHHRAIAAHEHCTMPDCDGQLQCDEICAIGGGCGFPSGAGPRAFAMHSDVHTSEVKISLTVSSLDSLCPPPLLRPPIV